MSTEINHAQQSPASKGLPKAAIVAAVIAVIGAGLWIFQLAGGMVNTNMRNLDAWGIYLILFMLFVGLSAGGLIISSAPKVFGLKGFGGISKIAIWVSIVCTVLAMVFVIVDLGGPLRAYELLIFANVTSPLIWDILVLTVYLIISILYLRATIRAEKGIVTASKLRLLSGFALIIAILVHTITAWIFGLQTSHEFWNTALLGPWFVSSALVSGLALVLIVSMALHKKGYLALEPGRVTAMAKLLGIFTAADLYFFVCDLLTAGYTGGDGGAVVSMLTTGPLAGFFWAEIIFGIATMLIAFVPRFRTNGFIVCASIISVLAIFCKRVQLMLGGWQIENIDFAGPTSGPALSDAGAGLQSVFSSLVYFPSFLELGVVCGVLALGAAILLIGIQKLPLQPVSKGQI